MTQLIAFALLAALPINIGFWAEVAGLVVVVCVAILVVARFRAVRALAIGSMVGGTLWIAIIIWVFMGYSTGPEF